MISIKNLPIYGLLIMAVSVSCTSRTADQAATITDESTPTLEDILIASSEAVSPWFHGPAAWEFIDTGLEFIEIDSAIWVFRIDPEEFRFTAVYGNKRPLTEWAKGYAGGINLGMFHDGKNPSGYTKIDGKVVQPQHSQYNLYMVWDKKTFKILDRTRTPIEEVLAWPNVSQNIRMIIPSGKRNRWQVNEKQWSVATIATTTDDKVLFIHSRKPYTMHDFIEVLLAHDDQLHIAYMLYTEGGPESSIVINGTFTHPLPYRRMGSYETGFWEYDNNDSFWDLPFALVFN